MWRSHAKRKAERSGTREARLFIDVIGFFWCTIHGKKFSRFTYGSDSRRSGSPFAVVVIGFIEGYVLLPVGLASFLGPFFLTALVVCVLR